MNAVSKNARNGGCANAEYGSGLVHDPVEKNKVRALCS